MKYIFIVACVGSVMLFISSFASAQQCERDNQVHWVFPVCDGTELTTLSLLSHEFGELLGTVRIGRNETTFYVEALAPPGLAVLDVYLEVGEAGLVSAAEEGNLDPTAYSFHVHEGRLARAELCLPAELLHGCGYLSVAADLAVLGPEGEPVAVFRTWAEGTNLGDGTVTSYCAPHCSRCNAEPTCPSGNEKRCQPGTSPCNGSGTSVLPLTDESGRSCGSVEVIRDEEQIEVRARPCEPWISNQIYVQRGEAGELPLHQDEFSPQDFELSAAGPSLRFAASEDGCEALAIAVFVESCATSEEPYWLWAGEEGAVEPMTRICIGSCQENRPGFRIEVCSRGLDGMSGSQSLPLQDDEGRVVPIGFSFPFLGGIHEEVGISSNGYLSFLGPLDSYVSTPLPRSARPNGIVAPLWTDLDPGQGGAVRYATLGNATERHFVTEWRDVPRVGQEAGNTFQVALFEAGGIVELRYGDVSPEPVAGVDSIGVEGPDGEGGLTLDAHRTSEGCLRLVPQVEPPHPQPAPAAHEASLLVALSWMVLQARRSMTHSGRSENAR